ncbi:partial Germacrene A synthase, partial [Patescibacteria group bacterium]
MIQDFIIPTIYCPFPSKINSHVDALQQHTLDWVQQFNLVADDRAWYRLKKSQFHRLAARAYPTTSLERLAIIADWNIWLFILDDQCDEWGIGKHPEQHAILHNRCLE